MSQGSYRDETEALRAKVTSLEARLEAAEREPHRLEPALRKKRIKALEEEVRALEAKNASLASGVAPEAPRDASSIRAVIARQARATWTPRAYVMVGIAIGFFLGIGAGIYMEHAWR